MCPKKKLVGNVRGRKSLLAQELEEGFLAERRTGAKDVGAKIRQRCEDWRPWPESNSLVTKPKPEQRLCEQRGPRDRGQSSKEM